jgi:hypothetical protein
MSEIATFDELPQSFDQIGLGEYDGRYNNVIPDCVANPCVTALR